MKETLPDFEIPIYPEVATHFKEMTIKKEKNYFLRLSTRVRLEYKRKWYLYTHHKEFITKNLEDMPNFMNFFHKEVHKSKYMTRVSSKIVWGVGPRKGEVLFPLDKNQDTERKRIKKRYGLKKQSEQ